MQLAGAAQGGRVSTSWSINGGVSGDTTAGGLARLDWAMAIIRDFALVELGANDMLRGLDPQQADANLDRSWPSCQRRK